MGENLEVWRTRVTNERDATAHVSLFSAIEWCLWDAHDDATNFQRNYSIGEVEVEDGVIYHKTEYRERRDHFAWFACSEALAGFDTQRDDFLGPLPRLGSIPLAVEEGRARDSIAHGWQPIGSHHVRLELAPGETREVIFVLGYAENPADAKFDPPGSQTINKRTVRPLIERYTSASAVAGSLRRAARPTGTSCWASSRCDTPDEHTRPHGQHLERLPVHGHLQPQPLGLLCSSRVSAAAWASATPTRTCSASCTWSLNALGSGSSISAPRSCRPAVPTISTSR